jgi:hypothetical protein
VFSKVAFALYFVGLIGLSIVALTRDAVQASASEAEKAAHYWVNVGTIQPARLEDDEWEVDVLRPDGSLVEVAFDHELKLRDFDQELGAGGTLANDEVTGPLRHRAILKALAVTGPGRVPSVERDSPNEIEVNVRPGDGTQIEVELDAELRVAGVRPEDPGDE